MMTGPNRVRVVSRWERFKRLLVWHPINTDPQDDNKWTTRVWLPFFDLLVVGAGLVAFHIGTPILEQIFPEWIIDVVSVLFAITGVVTFIGVCIPRLWRIEIVGKIAIAFLLTTYALLVLSFPLASGNNNLFSCLILIMASWGIYPRLTKLFIDGTHRREQRKRMRV